MKNWKINESKIKNNKLKWNHILWITSKQYKNTFDRNRNWQKLKAQITIKTKIKQH